MHHLIALLFGVLFFGVITDVSAQAPMDCQACNDLSYLLTDRAARTTKYRRYDKGYAIVSNSKRKAGWQATLTVLDRKFQPKWSKTINELVSLYDFVVTDQGDFLLVGQAARNERGQRFINSKSVLLKISADGALVWHRQYDLGQRESFSRIYRHPNPVNPDYPFYIKGAVNSSSYPSSYDYSLLINLNQEGDFNYYRAYDFTKTNGRKSKDTQFDDLVFTDDGNILLSGSTNWRYTHSFLATIDATTGAPIRAKQWNTPGYRGKIFSLANGLFLTTSSETPQQSRPFQMSLVTEQMEIIDHFFLPGAAVQQVFDLVHNGKDQYRMAAVTAKGDYLNFHLSIDETSIQLKKSGELQLGDYPLVAPIILPDKKSKNHLVASGIKDMPGVLFGKLPELTSPCFTPIIYPTINDQATLNDAVLFTQNLVIPTPTEGKGLTGLSVKIENACDYPYELPEFEDMAIEEDRIFAPPPPPPPPPTAYRTILSIPTSKTGVRVSVQTNKYGDRILIERGAAKGEIQLRLSDANGKTVSIESMFSVQRQEGIKLTNTETGEFALRITAKDGEETVKFKRSYSIVRE